MLDSVLPVKALSRLVTAGTMTSEKMLEEPKLMAFLKDEEADNPFAKINQLQALLHDLDERGLILSLAAFAEDSLGELIGAFMRPGDAATRLLEGFNAPLGTFSARIQAAYALGLITKNQYSDLEHLRKIRNAFAHSWIPVSFLDQKVSAHIANINYSRIDDRFPETSLDKVRSSLPSLLVELQVTTKQIMSQGHRVRVIGTELSSGVAGTIDEQIAACRKKLAELNDELATASGEKQKFLEMIRERWVIKFFRVISHAQEDQQAELLTSLCGFVEGGFKEVKSIVDGYLYPRAPVD